MNYVYIIESIKTGRRYVGTSEDVQERLRQHNKRSVRSTKAYAPYQLITTESFATKIEARRREKQIKQSGILRKLFRNTLPGPIV